MTRPTTILHIEDDPANRLLVRKLLAAEGMQVVDAETGLEGVRKALELRPHLVLIDLNIPDLDGYEVALRLRSDPATASTPLVAITAEGDRDTSLAVGCDGFIQKPIQARKFADEVRSYLQGRRERPTAQGDGRLRAQSEKIVRHLEEKVAELVTANERLRQMDKLRKEFYRNVSHELATPLTPIVGYLSMLINEELGPLGKAQLKALRATDDCTRRLRGLIDNLLDVTGLETGKIRFVHKDYDFLDTVRRAIASLADKMADQGVELVEELPRGPLPAYGDADRVGRAVAQILDNACKFTPRGGQAGVRVRNVPGHYELYVADAGPGIPEDEIEHVFEAFVQVDGSTTRQFGGVGLGLALVRRVAQAQGGDCKAVARAGEPIAGAKLSGAGVYMMVAHRAPEEMRTP
ncbi:MAG: hybrid sensor histidine kinase/response regulator [Myxococcales bacterium]|nr:hybrid sensor histidine kinase/response regulator [Myxococcales bacterium]